MIVEDWGSTCPDDWAVWLVKAQAGIASQSDFGHHPVEPGASIQPEGLFQ
jgi:hypothetical protein